MKKIMIMTLCTLLTLASNAQSDKYFSAMTARLSQLDTTRTVQGFNELAHTFERIGEAEKTQWHPYYYAALAYVNAGYFTGNGQMGGLASKLDPIADKAEALALKAEALKPDDSEIWALKKMITTLRFMAEPMQRYPMMQEAANQLEKARELNPQNPRVDLLEGQDKFYTPEQFGGSKAEARKLFEQALKKFEAFKTSDPLDPRWGRNTSVEMLKRISQ